MITEKNISELRKKVTENLSEYRARHILSTEEEAAKLAETFFSEIVEKARISALLHDITKEYTVEEHLRILREFGNEPEDSAKNSPKVLHSLTAALIIPKEYPEYADEEVISAVKKHTTGAGDMSLLDCIIYLADYIEPTRTFKDCIELREYFWSGTQKCSCQKEKLLHLYRTMVMSFDMTIANLIDEHCVIAPETFLARNAFLRKILEEEKNERPEQKE